MGLSRGCNAESTSHVHELVVMAQPLAVFKTLATGSLVAESYDLLLLFETPISLKCCLETKVAQFRFWRPSSDFFLGFLLDSGLQRCSHYPVGLLGIRR